MGGEGMICDSGLVLRLGYEGWASLQPCVKLEPSIPCSASPAEGSAEPSLSLSLSEVAVPRAAAEVDAGRGGEPRVLARQSSPHSAVSSFSGAYPASSGATKREKDVVSEEVEAERGVSCRASDEEEEGSARKKLRLTKAQSALLEDMFREHSTLNPKQKQALAKQLNLRPRQVEVWFQNRRARTKLKQTEMDCELLRRCCESLTDENRRLQKELQELKALKFPSPALYMQLRPPATLTMCPSCERMAGPAAGAGDVTKGGVAGAPFATATRAHFYNPFAAHPPPAAC
ncbi:hypothetical protein Taro_020936 [Colocasia esculenta]|uniref:Homeobox domain-containing protein n=1 Tax=Colocasia esculenta TaxID=4460 RepID=A0A843V0Z3_COLES|nr:hypothetical protein [Colocasia esculenta]